MNETEKDLERLFQICHMNLKNSEKCLNYLQETRKISLPIIEKYQIGFFPQNVNRLLEHVSSQVLQKLSIIDYSENSLFSEYFYLIFPIFSEYGEPVGIGGRTLLNDDEREVFNLPKYKNSSFKKVNYLYGLNNSKESILKEQNVYVVEGYFDHISLDLNNIPNSVAICGTAFSKNHILKLARYTDKITFVLDRDDSGKRAMEKIYAKHCNQGIKLRFMTLPEECKDVDDYFRKGGTSNSFLNDLEGYIPNW